MNKKKQQKVFQKAVENGKRQNELARSPKVKMKFDKDQFYVRAETREHDLANPIYKAGQVYEIDAKDVERWLKRGGVIVKDEPKPAQPPKVEDQKPALDTDKKEPVEPSEKKEEDESKPKSQSPEKSETTDGKQD